MVEVMRLTLHAFVGPRMVTWAQSALQSEHLKLVTLMLSKPQLLIKGIAVPGGRMPKKIPSHGPQAPRPTLGYFRGDHVKYEIKNVRKKKVGDASSPRRLRH